MAKFKIGDKVKVVEYYDKQKIGTVGIVNDIVNGNHLRIDGSNTYIQDTCLELCGD